MNCRAYQLQFDDYLDGELAEAQSRALEAHIESCEGCRKQLANERLFRRLLREDTLPAPRAGFEQRAFDKLHRHQNRQGKGVHFKSFWTGFGSAIPATILLFILVSYFGGRDVFNTESAIPGIQMSLYETRKVKLVFEVPEAVADATFSMQLPEHVVIAGTAMHQIEWKTALKKGKNLLSLPIVAKSLNKGELIARIRYGDKEKIFRLKLDVSPQKQGLNSLNIGGLA